MFELNRQQNFLLSLFISAFFALAVVAVPWEVVHGTTFVDREVYFSIFSAAPDVRISFEFVSLLAYVVNEQLWSQSIRWLNVSLGLSLQEIFGIITFVSTFSYALFVSSRVHPLAILLLVNPLLVDLVYSQLRMSLAMAFLLAAYSCRGRVLMLCCAAIACMLHTASFLFIFMIFCIIFSVRLAYRYDLTRLSSYILVVWTGFLMALLVGPLRVIILEWLGDRRAVYDAPATTWSYASIWIFILGAACIQTKMFFRDHTNAIALTFLSVYVFCTLFSVYGLRFLSAALPFFIVALCRFGSVERALVILLFAAYSVLQWLYWIN
jgi:hypothetical protein